ncbi:helix-turn-helix domain-containing protein [Oceanispirochaeta sp.]|jgi:AraC family transcriptional activator of pobA|uniref:AraC family transcriptional regulator n=1 Tax=Oceanispirochaeta sp. TaxID=2035350 RepID=UPI00345CD034
MDLISIENYENTRLESEDFQFNCFHIQNADTPPHWHNHTEIIFIKQGNCSIYINGTAFMCSEGDIILVPHGCLHSILCNTHSVYIAIVIGDTLFSSMVADSHINRSLRPFFSDNTYEPIQLSKQSKSYCRFLSLIVSIIDEESNQKNSYEMIVKVELCRFFSDLTREFPELLFVTPIQQSSVILKMKKAIEYIFIHYSDKISISFMARYSNMSDQHFCRLFKSYTGKTFIDFLSDYRLEQSNLLLKTTDLPITGIPELVGFCNVNYYSRVYKKKYGYPPSFVRKGRANL